MPQVLTVGQLSVQVSRKDIQNIHLAVNPPDGHVTVSVPTRTDEEALRLFVISKLSWIRRQQRQMTAQERVPPREYLTRESHWVWGARYLLEIVEEDMPPTVTLRPKKLWLRVRPAADKDACHELLSAWYRAEVRKAARPMLDTWSAKMNVEPQGLYVQRMKTKWGSCNPKRGTIRLNSELGKKSPECLEYVVVHELAHLIEPTHNERFRAVMDRVMPSWPERRQLLNSTPLAQEDWGY